MAEPDYSEFTPVEEPVASGQPQAQDWSEFTPVEDEVKPLSEYDTFKQQQVDESNKPFISKVFNQVVTEPATALIGTAKHLVNTGVGALKEDAQYKTNLLTNPIQTVKNQAQTNIEGASRAVGDIGELGRSVINDPFKFTNPLQSAVIGALRPKSEADIEKAYLESKYQQLAQENRKSSSPVQIPGAKVNENTAEALSLVADPQAAIEAMAAKTALKGASNLIPKPKATASPLIAEPVQFIKPINGKNFGHISDVMDSTDRLMVEKAVAPKNKGKGYAREKDAVTRGIAEAIRNDPANTTTLHKLRESSEDALDKVMAEVNLLKAQVPPQMMDDVATRLEAKIHKGMDPEHVDMIKATAAKYRGQQFEINDIHNTTKYLGKQLIPLWKSDDARSAFARDLMAEERMFVNEKLTKSLESVGGDRGGRLRGTASDLIKLNENIDAQTARLAKNIPPELRGSMANLEGRIALVSAIGDMFTNPVAGAVKGAIGIERLLKGRAKEMWTNPNKQVEKLNKSLRRKVKFETDLNPPSPEVYSPQPLPPRLS